MKRLRFKDLSPGLLFQYKGPRSYLLRRSSAFGQILGTEAGSQIVHVRTFLDDPKQDSLGIDIAFLPIAFPAFKNSVIEIKEPRDVPSYWWEARSRWLEKFSQDSAGAFDIPLWKAEELSWRVVPTGEQTRIREQRIYLDYAYPKKSPSEKLDTIEVSYIPPDKPS